MTRKINLVYKTAITIFGIIVTIISARGQNPYMPLWEHIPDGEPYVFEDPDRPGKYRVYVYGSHDDLITDYCGLNQVVWSASVDDLTQWRYDGVCFLSTEDNNGKELFMAKVDANGKRMDAEGRGDLLYAPDIVEVMENGSKVYYFTPNNQAQGRQTMVCKGERPDGPFKVCNWAVDGETTTGCFGFDPAIFKDDDGCVYGYWGFNRSYAAELDPNTMCSVKPGTEVVEDMISGLAKGQQGIFRFFEASSIRKIKSKYVFIYSRFTEEGEFGLPRSNYNLAYAYSDKPLGPWTYGGTIIDGRGRDTDEQGNPIVTGYNTGNTHGSIAEINGQWYVFYHRHTGTDEFSRQAMVAPIDVKVEKTGRVVIREGEVTSEGFRVEGLNPLERVAAGWACYFTGPRPMTSKFPKFFPSGSYPAATRPDKENLNASFSFNHTHAPMVNNTDGSTIGYKYFNMSELAKRGNAAIDLHLKPLGVQCEIIFMLDSPYKSRGGREIGRLKLTGNEKQEAQHFTTNISGLKSMKGKRPLYILFRSDAKDKSLCDLYDFIFKVDLTK